MIFKARVCFFFIFLLLIIINITIIITIIVIIIIIIIIILILQNESSLKIMKNAFYFIKKTVSVLENFL